MLISSVILAGLKALGLGGRLLRRLLEGFLRAKASDLIRGLSTSMPMVTKS